MFYIVTEVQQNNGTPTAIIQAYPENQKQQAYARYFTILAAASVTALELHGAIIQTADGVTLESYVFDRREE